MIRVEIDNFQLYNITSDDDVDITDSNVGTISTAVANAVVQALRNSVTGVNIREDDLAVKITTGRVTVEEVTETYIGR